MPWQMYLHTVSTKTCHCKFAKCRPIIIILSLFISERELYAVARPSVVCCLSVGNALAPYSGHCNFHFRQYFYGIWYVGHPLISTKNFMEIVPGEALRRGEGTPPSGELNTTGVAKYSNFGPIKGYILETVQDGR